MIRSSRSSSRTRAFGLAPSASGGHSAAMATVGLDVEVAAQGLDGGLDAQAGLGLVDLEPLLALAQLGQLALGVAAVLAQLVELAGHGPRGLGLPAPALAQLLEPLASITAVRSATMAMSRSVTTWPAVELDPTDLGLGALGGHADQARSRSRPGAARGTAAARRTLLVRTSTSVRSAPTCAACSSSRERASPMERPRSALAFSSASSAGRASSSSSMRSRSRVEPLGELVDVALERLGLGGGVALLGLDALQAVGGGRQATVVLVELARPARPRPPGLVERGAGVSPRDPTPARARSAAPSARWRASSSAAPVAPAPATPTRQPGGAEAVAARR